ncbi:hypothetical protein [Litoreibacter roseus]|uniref:Uncharacterized protein n=1 Tax=Litoreibacter roseus TaxID=2601869 RepID=A0A6N6JMI5_9RHOB|nr:hypothetical protein [Litoreibacter roseus]GFE67374.1 hypothetical protein KIN_44480 [Litoreibacter roseus]
MNDYLLDILRDLQKHAEENNLTELKVKAERMLMFAEAVLKDQTS